MKAVYVIPRKWGNSIAIRIPKEKLEGTDIHVNRRTVVWLPEESGGTLEDVFGKGKGLKIDPQQVKDEARKDWK